MMDILRLTDYYADTWKTPSKVTWNLKQFHRRVNLSSIILTPGQKTSNPSSGVSICVSGALTENSITEFPRACLTVVVRLLML